MSDELTLKRIAKMPNADDELKRLCEFVNQLSELLTEGVASE